MSVSRFAPGGCCCGGATPCLSCGDCCIPETDLVLSDSSGPATLILTWTPGLTQWIYDDGFDKFVFYCDDGGAAMTHENPDILFEQLDFIEWTCIPFHVKFHSVFGLDYFVDGP